MTLPITIESTSPLVNYSSADWVPWNDDAGRRYQVARTNSSSMSFEFYGTGVTIQGRSTSAYQVQLDTSEPLIHEPLRPEDRILYSATNLSASAHRVVLTSRANATQQQQLVGFDQAIIENPEDSAVFETWLDNQNSSVFTYNGKWSLQSTKGVPNDTTTSLYRTTTENGASVSLSFTQSRTVSVRGMLDEDSGMYTVEMEGNTTAYNGSRSALVPDALLFYRSGLDPNNSYTLVLTNNGPGEKRFSLNSVVLHQTDTTTDPSKTPLGSSGTSTHKTAIIGASVAGAVLIVSVAFYCLYRYRRSRANKAKGTLASQRQRQSHEMRKPYNGSVHRLSDPACSSSALDLAESTSSISTIRQTESTSAFTSISQQEPLQEASQPLSLPPPPQPSTQYLFRNGRTTMSWSQAGDSLAPSEVSSPTQESSMLYSGSVWPEDDKSSGKQNSQPESTPSTPASRKPRPLPSVPSSSAATTEEHDAGIYSEGSLLRLLSARSTNGIQPDPLAPPPRYEPRK